MKECAIIFDMDGVIVDNHEFHFKAWKEFCEKYGIHLNEDDFKENINGRTISEVVSFVFKKELSAKEIKDYGDEKESMYRNIYKDYIKPVRGIEDFLRHLKGENVKVAVATSAPTVNVDFTLDTLNLRRYFDLIIDSTFVEKGKPDPQVYLVTAEKLGMAPERCIVFEDSVSGIKAGKNAGMWVIGLETTHEAKDIEEADAIIKDFEGLTYSKIKELCKM
jgi:beta-phosphoglucomutase